MTREGNKELAKGIARYWRHYFKELGLTPDEVIEAMKLHRGGRTPDNAVATVKAARKAKP